MHTFNLDIDSLETKDYLKYKFQEFAHHCLDKQFHEIQGESTGLLKIPLLHEELLLQGVKPKQLSRPPKKLLSLGSSLELELNLGPDTSFRFYKDRLNTLIIWQQQDLGITESGVCSLNPNRRNSGFIIPTVAEHRLSERQMAAFLIHFAKTYQKEVREAFDKKIFEVQKRNSKRQMDRAAISALVEERMRALQLEYIITGQVRRMCVQIRLSAVNELVLYIPYKNFRESIEKQFQAIDKIQEGLSLLNSQGAVRACNSLQPWVKPAPMTENEGIIEL